MIDKKIFLATYNLTEEDLNEARISWEELAEIYDDYAKKFIR